MEAPKQPTLVWALKLLLNPAAGCAIVTFCVVEHPFASVTVHVHVPTVRLFAVALFCAGTVFQLYEYGDVPFATATVALPVAAAKHPTLVRAHTLLLSAAAGCVMVALCVVAHPFASVMVQVQVPAARLVAVAPFCTGAVFQLME